MVHTTTGKNYKKFRILGKAQPADNCERNAWKKEVRREGVIQFSFPACGTWTSSFRFRTCRRARFRRSFLSIILHDTWRRRKWAWCSLLRKKRIVRSHKFGAQGITEMVSRIRNSKTLSELKRQESFPKRTKTKKHQNNFFSSSESGKSYMVKRIGSSLNHHNLPLNAINPMTLFLDVSIAHLWFHEGWISGVAQQKKK